MPKNSMDEDAGNMIDTPAYQVLRAAGALCNQYRIHSADELDAIEPNSEAFTNCMLDAFCFPFSCMFKTFEVPAGNVTMVEDGRGKYEFRKEGVHLICDPFYSVGETKEFDINTIIHGDRVLLVVEQGYVGLAMDKGQPVLLGPGLHQWQSPTLRFVEHVDLNSNVIRIGPMTLVTVDEGYEAITEDNGQQKILEGGTAHLLTHRNWKFQKFVSKKINSDNLPKITARSADNVVIDVEATIVWRVTDVETAGVNACATISTGGSDEVLRVDDVARLRSVVLKQSEASLAAYIGSVDYSSRFALAAAVQSAKSRRQNKANLKASDEKPEDGADEENEEKDAANESLFTPDTLAATVAHANAPCSTYGVTLLSINVVSAVPSSELLQSALSQGAVAAAEAQKFETVARGKASAAKIEAQGAKDAEIARAKGDAASEQIRAEGSRKAADLLQGSSTAIRFQMVEKTGQALSDKTTFFFPNGRARADKTNLVAKPPGRGPGLLQRLLAPKRRRQQLESVPGPPALDVQARVTGYTNQMEAQ